MDGISYNSLVQERVCWDCASCRRGLRRGVKRAQRANGAPLFIEGDGATGDHCPGVGVIHHPGLAVGGVSNKQALPGRVLHLCPAACRDVRKGWAAKDAEVVQAGGFASYGLQRRKARAKAARSHVEDMDSAAYGKLPVTNREFCMREHA